MKLHSPSEFYMAAKYRGHWVPRSRYGLSARRTHDPSGISSSAPVQRRDSLDNPLLGSCSSTRCSPTSPPPTSRLAAPLLGFRTSLQRISRRESTSRQLPGRAPRFCRESIGRSQPTDYGATHRLSQPLSGLLPLLHPLPFSDRWHSWDSTLQGIIPSTKPRMLVAAGVPS